MDGQSDVIDLREYLRLLVRRRWTVLLVAGLVIVAALALTLAQTPIYRATTDLAIEPVRQSSDTSLEEILFPNTLVETERRVVASLPVATRVVEALGLGEAPRDLLEDLSVTTIRDTRVLEVSYDDPSAQRAADVSLAFADAYLLQRRQAAVQELTAARGVLENQADVLRDEVARLTGLIDAAGTDTERETLQLQLDAANASLTTVQSQISETASSNTAVVRGGGTILTPAEVPRSPASPRPLRTGVLALVLGLMLGVAAALLRDYLDDAIRSDDDLKRAMHGTTVLGRIPHWEAADSDERRAAVLLDPRSVVAEAYRAMRTNVRFLLSASRRERTRTRPGGADVLGGPGQSVLFTSATAGDGKTSTAANIAITIAQSGRRVCLVDADMRKPRLAEVFGLPGGAGLSDTLASMTRVEEVLQDVGVDNLQVITSGAIPPNPAELLGSPSMRSLQYDLEAQFDVVVIDSPPVLSVADALEVAVYAHGVVVVAASGRSSRRAVRQATEALGDVGAHVFGGVLNDIEAGSAYYGYEYYYRDYTETPPDEPTSAGRSRGLRGRGGRRATTRVPELASADDRAAPVRD